MEVCWLGRCFGVCERWLGVSLKGIVKVITLEKIVFAWEHAFVYSHLLGVPHNVDQIAGVACLMHELKNITVSWGTGEGSTAATWTRPLQRDQQSFAHSRAPLQRLVTV